MKSLILKDLYNISHNAKQLLFTLIFLAVCLMPSSGASGYAITVTIICSMMTMTTFSMDERSSWMKYALIMPVTRKDYVASKYVVNLIFSLFGMAVGTIVASAGELIKGNGDILSVFICSGVGLALGIFFGSLFVPLLIKWGAEQARMISVVAVAIPALVVFCIYKLLEILGIQVTDNMVIAGLIALPFVILLITFISFKISVKLMKRLEF